MRFLSVYKCPETEAPPTAEEMARDFLKVAGDGECELRPLYDANPSAAHP